MEETLILDEEIDSTAQPVKTEAEGKEGANREDISLGKFKDVNALLNAYNSLQAEFTKRCQRIKELEGKNDKVEVIGEEKDNSNAQITVAQTPFKEAKVEDLKDEKATAQLTDEQKREVLQDYLKEILRNKQRAIILDDRGVGVRTPVAKPKSIAEAGALAKEIL